MNLKHAQYIMEIIKQGSITNASKTMHVSQPALSQTIKAVEKYLGAPIFLRNTNPIVLTEAGKKYIAAVKQVITISSNLLHEVADIQYEGYGTLRLGIPIQRAMQMLPSVMPVIRQRYPHIKLICCSIFPRSQGVTVANAAGWTQADANASIEHIAKQFGGYYVDCTGVPFSSNWSYYTIDNLHPTAPGHKLLAECITKSLLQQGVISENLKQTAEADTAECLLDLSFDSKGIVNKGTFETTVGSAGAAARRTDGDPPWRPGRADRYGGRQAAAGRGPRQMPDPDRPYARGPGRGHAPGGPGGRIGPGRLL